MARLARLIAVAAAAATAAGVTAAGDESILTSEIGRLNNQSLLWGPYKPNLYFGMRPRLPQGLMAVLMWGRINNHADINEGIRYTCEQNDGMHGYGWDEYDARDGGVQTIHDDANMIDMTTSLVKIPGGNHGGSWAVRVKGKLMKNAAKDHKTAIYLYIAQEAAGELNVIGTGTEFGFEGDVRLDGKTEALGNYQILVTKGNGKHPTSDHPATLLKRLDTTVVASETYPNNLLWQARPLLYRELQKPAKHFEETYGSEDLPPASQMYRINHTPGRANTHMVQKTFEGDFQFDLVFMSASMGRNITSKDVTREIKRTSESFGERFSSVFDFQAPFKAAKYQQFGKSMFSNLLGGVGYFHGDQVIDRSYAAEYEEEDENFWVDAAEARARGHQKAEGPFELFTSIPSRPFFPRGFLWDEGFHLMPIADWDMDLALEIVKSWYNTMDADGWIPREQILGDEARGKVPEEFQVQYPHYANPPTLFLVIEDFMERLRKSNGSGPAPKEKLSQDETLHSAHLDISELGEEYVRKLYPLLRRQYDWFRKTQSGDVKSYEREARSAKEVYRWRGRTETHCLTSGLDDYPRAQPPHPGELHVDLLSWVGLMTKSLMNIADSIGLTSDVAELAKNLEGIEGNLVDLHWSEKDGCFCDATIDEFEENKLVCHKGYISLFPFLVGLLRPDDAKVGRMLDLMGDENELWSGHGLRSLSRGDEFYGTGENYWRGPVWMPFNYMAVTQLYRLAKQPGPFSDRARDMYTRLRKDLVETVYESWKETGFAWEQYNPETGAGQRTQHFTGWTSLVVKLMAMEDLSGQHERDEL
ncbi:glucosidase I [Drechmeria coniospora]|uniref:Mannosyl-oligosaccharide glucosidase n=1 Tax=Drechmeria coniospora TaxID=98403 RepID=A0A151GX62_DRECN|nr:glucosidase I [Drechmeria coniospora]KYK61633.1 glucosidase I [Drechmeria coniospora]ODA79895.1 hypothetical protein RJ55_05492 [Drechmeria coniospora]